MFTPTSSIELGERIKSLRLAQDLTLKQLEAKAGVSATHVSEIERGLTSPTVGTIARIARALGEEPALLVASRGGGRVSVTRRAQRRSYTSEGVTISPLGGAIEGAEMSVVELALHPGDSDFDPGTGIGEELVWVASGSIDVRVGDAVHALAEGDTLHYDARAGRVFRARKTARVLWVARPARMW